jgi:hypothetical protein
MSATKETIGGVRSNVAVVKHGRVVGMVHKPGCFIVTTRWSDRDWQPVDEKVTCGSAGRPSQYAVTGSAKR